MRPDVTHPPIWYSAFAESLSACRAQLATLACLQRRPQKKNSMTMTIPNEASPSGTKAALDSELRDTYTRYRLCPNLNPGEKCFCVQRYNEGKVDEVFHEHVPSHRISLDSEIEALRALVSHCAGWPDTFILHSHLNNRRGGPSRYPGFTSHVEYPEEGVIRRYFSSGGATAWSDTVIAPGSFRQQVSRKRKAGRPSNHDA